MWAKQTNRRPAQKLRYVVGAHTQSTETNHSNHREKPESVGKVGKVWEFPTTLKAISAVSTGGLGLSFCGCKVDTPNFAANVVSSNFIFPKDSQSGNDWEPLGMTWNIL